MAKQDDTQRWVFAQRTGTAFDKNGMGFQLVAGMPWPADAELVKQHPQDFGPEPPAEYAGHNVPRVERAVSAPGAVRA